VGFLVWSEIAEEPEIDVEREGSAPAVPQLLLTEEISERKRAMRMPKFDSRDRLIALFRLKGAAEFCCARMHVGFAKKEAANKIAVSWIAFVISQ